MQSNFCRPFREINVKNNSKSWDRVPKLGKGKVYVEVSSIFTKKKKENSSFIDWWQGNLTALVEMTHWQGHDVLYIGDHIYGDLAVSKRCCRIELNETYF